MSVGDTSHAWTHEEIQRAREILTPGQFTAWNLWTLGQGYRRISLQLGIHRQTVKDRIVRAEQKLAQDKRAAAAGRRAGPEAIARDR